MFSWTLSEASCFIKTIFLWSQNKIVVLYFTGQLNISSTSGPRSARSSTSQTPRTPHSVRLTPSGTPGKSILCKTPSLESLTPGRTLLRLQSKSPYTGKAKKNGKTPKKAAGGAENAPPPNPSQDRCAFQIFKNSIDIK